MARLPVEIIVEPVDNSTDQLVAALTGLEIEHPPGNSTPVVEQSSQTEGQSVRSKRRLATTRGFDNSGLQTASHQKLVTPINSPSRFLPAAGSTPLTPRRSLEDKLSGISAVHRVLLHPRVPLPPRSSSRRQLPPLPPSSPLQPAALPCPVPIAFRVSGYHPHCHS